MPSLTLHDLTQQFLTTHPHLPGAMYRTTASHLARMLGQDTPAAVVLTHTATELPEQLEFYLRSHARSSLSKVRNNKSQAQRLIRWGITAGLVPGVPALSPAWQEMWTRKKPIYRGYLIGKAFVAYCVEHRIEPQQVTAAHFHAWRHAYVTRAIQRQPASTARTYIAQTRVMVSTNTEWFPRLVVAELAIKHPLRIAFNRWPVRMQEQWQEVETWLTRPQLLGRRTRPWTPLVVQQLRGRLGELYGFLRGQGEEGSTLEAMLTPEHLREFLTYKFEVKNNSARSILSYLTAFRKALDFFRLPAHVLDEIYAALPAEDLELRPIARHTVPPCELLAELPTHVERAIAAREKEWTAPRVENPHWKQVRLALLWRLKLVFLFLLQLSWRMSSITQLRRGTFKDLPLYKASNCQLRHGLLYQDPRGQWRFFFPASATKNGRVVQGEIPAAIVPTLECYLSDHWPRLRASDRSFVFPNSEGRLSGTSEWCNIVRRETFRYLHTAANPHKFRHAFAFYYLTQRPEDYLTLSRYLWHRSVEITIQVYGGFGPEDALRHIEAWRAVQGTEPSVLQGVTPISPTPVTMRGVVRRPVLAGPARQRK